MGIYRLREGAPRPTICELGGKNPSVVSDKADIDKAAEGVMHGAFGFGGQKCASNSRSYIQRSVYPEFVDALRAMAEEIVIGDPRERGVYLGPLINDAAGTGTRPRSPRRARRAPCSPVASGSPAESRPRQLRAADGRRGAGGLVVVEAGAVHPVHRVEPYDDLGDAIAKANDTEFGLTAGFFSEDAGEIDRFLDGIEAGVVYVNRRASSTTGAWPGLQTFGGWKGSGTSGRSVGGPLLRFAVHAGAVADRDRELSREVMMTGTASLSAEAASVVRAFADTATRAVAHVPSSAIAPMIWTCSTGRARTACRS